MRRAPFIPGAPAPLEPPRILREPAVHFDDAALIAGCRRINAIATSWSIALAVAGLLYIVAGCIR